MLLETALSYADRQGLDLVLISPNANPPVAKIMDYGKFRYDQQKREKEAKKKQRIIEVKEIRLSTFIEQHDLEVKGTMAKKFLTEGDKLKVSLRFKGRERGRTDRGFEVMQRFVDVLKDHGTPEKAPVLEGRSLIMIINPLPPKKEKSDAQDKVKPAEKTDTGTETAGAGPEGAALQKEGADKPDGVKPDDVKPDAAGGESGDGTGEKVAVQAEPKRKKVKGPSEEMD